MNELVYFNIGFWIGYLFVVFIFVLIYLIRYQVHINKFNKYLLETKQHQLFEEWMNKNKKTIKVIKHG